MMGLAVLGFPLVVGMFLSVFGGAYAFRASRKGKNLFFVFLGTIGVAVLLAAAITYGGPPWENATREDYVGLFKITSGLMLLPMVPVVFFCWSFGKLRRAS
ncbi:hypothetical protein CSC82_08570 [Rhodobacteraceae bacterium 4F10]|nr:hypothetical protein CSC82_08570 [Rhodobacteraceae bacterium 4F10]